MNCPSCGAPGHGLVCRYCGNSLVQAAGPTRELQVLAEYHQLLAHVPADVKSRFLQSGYMPTTDAALIEAGLRCIAFLDPWSGEGGVTPANDAVQRIEMIAARLRITSKSGEVERAVEGLAQAVANYRKRRTRVWLAVAAVGACVALLILLLAALG